jgi:penicillin-binding protein 1A
MAYAHTNIEIKPVPGVDFTPEPMVIADTGAAPVEPEAERPPSLQPAAANKLLDMADRLRAVLNAAGGSEQASLNVSASKGL